MSGICSNGDGRPSDLTDEVKARVLSAIPEVIVQAQVANRARIPKSTLCTWLSRGKKEQQQGIDSIYSQFSNDYYSKLSDVLKEILDKLREGPKSYGAYTWLLERCFREDFGAESEDIKLLKALVYETILPIVGKGFPDGKEVKEESQ